MCVCVFWVISSSISFTRSVHTCINMLINIWMTASTPPPFFSWHAAYTCACVTSKHEQRGLREAISTAGGQVHDITQFRWLLGSCAWGRSSSDNCRSELNCQCCSEDIISLYFLSIWASLCYHFSQIIRATGGTLCHSHLVCLCVCSPPGWRGDVEDVMSQTRDCTYTSLDL